MENYVASGLAEIYGYVPQLESKRLLLCRLGLFDEEVLLLLRGETWRRIPDAFILGRFAARIGQPPARPLDRIPSGKIVVVTMPAKSNPQMRVVSRPRFHSVGNGR